VWHCEVESAIQDGQENNEYAEAEHATEDNLLAEREARACDHGYGDSEHYQVRGNMDDSEGDKVVVVVLALI